MLQFILSWKLLRQCTRTHIFLTLGESDDDLQFKPFQTSDMKRQISANDSEHPLHVDGEVA